MTEPQTYSRPTGREARRVLDAELLAELRHFAQTSTEFMQRLAGQSVNNVLDVFTATFAADASGLVFITRDYNVAAGCIQVSNLAAAGHFITVVAGSPGQSAPPGGTGVYLVDGGTTRTIALASRVVTLWGTAADKVSFQVFTAAVAPGTS
jgi:hypothetical protein